MAHPLMNHNGGPDIDGRQQSLRTRWAKALFADPTTPAYVMAIAWAVHWYSRADGSGAALSNQQLQMICGISEPTATRGKRWLRDNGYVQLRVGTGDQKTEFKMSLPEVSESDGVISQTTQPQTTQPEMTQGHQTDEARVIPPLVYIQERDSVPIQDKKPDVSAAPADGRSFWAAALNSQAHKHQDVLFQNGKLTLLNGTRVDWLKRFSGDEERLDLALIQIAPVLQPNSNRPLTAQVDSQLARIAGEKRDRDVRYNQAATANKATKAKPKPASRW